MVPNVNATLSAVYADLHGPNVARANRAKNKTLQKSGNLNNILVFAVANKGTSEF